jgi:hypothetical protein
VDALKERRADGTALAGSLDDKQPPVDLAGLGDELAECSSLLRPLLKADKPPAPIDVRRALATLERAVNDYIHCARLAPAA